jgi:hypothetical protein
VPATQVEFDHRNESLQRIVNIGHWQECFWMCHEAVGCQYYPFPVPSENDVLCDPFQHRPRLENKRRKGDSAQVSSGPELGYNMRQDFPK